MNAPKPLTFPEALLQAQKGHKITNGVDILEVKDGKIICDDQSIFEVPISNFMSRKWAVFKEPEIYTLGVRWVTWGEHGPIYPSTDEFIFDKLVGKRTKITIEVIE
jgi:hypothetical protein